MFNSQMIYFCIIVVLLHLPYMYSMQCTGQVGGLCGVKGTCCGNRGCCNFMDCCYDSFSFTCWPPGFNCPITMNKTEIGEIKKVKLTLPMPPIKNDHGTLYSEYVTTATNYTGTWEFDRTVHSSEVRKGQYVWWPKEDTKEYDKLIVLPIEHWNVTETAPNCCWSISIGFPVCSFKYCCGTGYLYFCFILLFFNYLHI